MGWKRFRRDLFRMVVRDYTPEISGIQLLADRISCMDVLSVLWELIRVFVEAGNSVRTQPCSPASHPHAHKYISCWADGKVWKADIVVTFWHITPPSAAFIRRLRHVHHKKNSAWFITFPAFEEFERSDLSGERWRCVCLFCSFGIITSVSVASLPSCNHRRSVSYPTRRVTQHVRRTWHAHNQRWQLRLGHTWKPTWAAISSCL